jgi:hypothetical protein
VLVVDDVAVLDVPPALVELPSTPALVVPLPVEPVETTVADAVPLVESEVVDLSGATPGAVSFVRLPVSEAQANRQAHEARQRQVKVLGRIMSLISCPPLCREPSAFFRKSDLGECAADCAHSQAFA